MFEEPLSYRTRKKLERAEKRDRYRFLAGLGNFLSIILGIVCILLVFMLLITLISWLIGDIPSIFSVILTRF